jgi:hypothetical protein
VGEEIIYTDKLPYGMAVKLNDILMIGTKKDVDEKESA